MLIGSGSIDPDELRTVLKSCLRESAISLPEEKLDDLTLALFESADKDRSGAITFEELKAELENFPEVMENLTIRSAIRKYISFILHREKSNSLRKTRIYLQLAMVNEKLLMKKMYTFLRL